MRLRAIRLDNVRRFTEPVEVGPLGDGVTLLCEPNEAGKSTLFDALHALFFLRHTSFAAEVKALQPHSKGKVAVECDLEADGALWRVRKQWQSGAGGEARVWRDGVLAHQGDAAEDWLSALVVGERGGPGGLLWVRQGRVTLEAGRKEAGAELERRRDLLTAVSGALDQVTGGERMDRALDRVVADLARLETATGKAKAGGPWAAAEAEVDRWTERVGALRGQVATFRGELDDLRRVEGELTRAEDPEARAARAAELASVAAELEAAERHADKVEAAATRARLARQEAEAARAAAARAEAARMGLAQAEAAEVGAAEVAGTREAARSAAEAAASEAERVAAEARAARDQAADLMRQVRRVAEARAAAGRRIELRDRLARAEASEAARLEAVSDAALGPGGRDLARAEEAARNRDAKVALRDAGAPTVTFLPGADGVEVKLDGAALPAGMPRPLPRGGEVAVPGVGALRIEVPGGNDDGVDRAEAALRAALGDWPDLGAMRAAAGARAEAATRADAAKAARDAVAPDGLDALRAALAALPEAPEGAEDGPDAAEVEARLDEAEAAREEAEAGLAAAGRRREAARIDAATATAELRAARDRLGAARAEVAAQPEPAVDLEMRLTAAAEAERAHAALAQDAPPRDALKAKLDRLRGVEEGARTRIAALRERRAQLRERIEAGSEAGVEERLVEAEGGLARAVEARDRILFERDVLRRLRAALDEARSEARDAYFAPVARELRPLLGLLWDDAELDWSDDTLLPVTLTRRGTSEPIDVLSGGTQEQIAFLVRLAFARLLARSGRHAPLILDDALVYTDDDRIERMFDALHGAAGDLQILVLSCRQRAFAQLGAPQLRFEPVGSEG